LAACFVTTVPALGGVAVVAAVAGSTAWARPCGRANATDRMVAASNRLRRRVCVVVWPPINFHGNAASSDVSVYF